MIRTRSDEIAVEKGCWFDDDAADYYVRFIETYAIPTRGPRANQPVQLLPWQREIFQAIFGWKREDGRRRFRSGCLFVPRQNGKSFVCSWLSLAMLVADREPGAYCVISAVTGEQTRVVFDEVLNSVRQSEDLSAVLKCVPSIREIRFPKINARLKGLSNEGWGKLGNPPHCAIMDEFAFWPDYSPYDALRTGMDSRRQPLLFAISTSGTDRTTPAYEMHEYGRGILNGSVVDPWFFPAIFAAEPEDPIDDPKTWQKANPSLGVTIRHEETEAWANRAKQSKREELAFRQFRLDQWCTSVNQYLDLDAWQRAAIAADAWPELDGADSYIGVDLSQTRDLAAVATLTHYQGRWLADVHSFCCRAAVEKREAQNLQKYTVFEAEGSLTVHDGNIIDFEDVRAHIRNVCERRNVKVIAFDPREASDTILILKGEGLPAEIYPQGPLYMNGPMTRLESWLADGKFAYRGSLLLAWQAQNLEAKKDHRELLAPKKPDGNDAAKIDAMVAILIAIGKSIIGEAEQQADAGAGPSFLVI